MSVPIDRNLGDVSSLLTVHAEDAAAEVPDAGHRLLLLEVHDPEDAVIGAAGHEVVAAEVLHAGQVGALPLGLDICDHLAAAVVQHLGTGRVNTHFEIQTSCPYYNVKLS